MSEISPAIKYNQAELPVEVKLTLEPPKPTHGAGTFLMMIGGLIAAIGVGFIFFGPDTIYYDRAAGMNFIQILQAYPGPIATVGFFIVTGGQMINSSHINKQAENLEIQLMNEASRHLAFQPTSLPENQSLYFRHIRDDLYEIGIEEKNQLASA